MGDAPTLSFLSGCLGSVSCAPGVHSLTCTGLSDLVRSWIDGPRENFGIGLVPGSSNSGEIVLRSRRHPTGPPPRLIVEFDGPCP